MILAGLASYPTCSSFSTLIGWIASSGRLIQLFLYRKSAHTDMPLQTLSTYPDIIASFAGHSLVHSVVGTRNLASQTSSARVLLRYLTFQCDKQCTQGLSNRVIVEQILNTSANISRYNSYRQAHRYNLHFCTYLSRSVDH